MDCYPKGRDPRQRIQPHGDGAVLAFIDVGSKAPKFVWTVGFMSDSFHGEQNGAVAVATKVPCRNRSTENASNLVVERSLYFLKQSNADLC